MLYNYFYAGVASSQLLPFLGKSRYNVFPHCHFQARTQNMTLAVSFGAERDVAFEHAQNRCIVSMPQVTSSYLGSNRLDLGNS